MLLPLDPTLLTTWPNLNSFLTDPFDPLVLLHLLMTLKLPNLVQVPTSDPRVLKEQLLIRMVADISAQTHIPAPLPTLLLLPAL